MTVCRICSNVGDNRLHDAREMMFGTREPFRYLECGRCGTLQLDDVPDDLSPHYPADYYSFSNTPDAEPDFTVGSWKQRIASRAVANWFGRRRNLIGKRVAATRPWAEEHFPAFLQPVRLGITRHSRILDFGCGAGRLLLEMNEFGYRRLVGADAFIDADITYPNGVRVLRRSLADLRPWWDLIMLHHTFEHLPDPTAALAHLHRLLRRGRFALIRIPVVAEAWRRYGVDWFQLDPPRHLFLFTEPGFRQLADAAGFEVEAVIYDSTEDQFWMSEQYRRDIPMFDPRSHFVNADATVFDHDQIVAWKEQADELNDRGAGDQAAFYLRRR